MLQKLELTHQQLVSCPYSNHSTWKKLKYKNWHSAKHWKNAIDMALAPLFLKQSELDGEVPLSLTHSPHSFLPVQNSSHWMWSQIDEACWMPLSGSSLFSEHAFLCNSWSNSDWHMKWSCFQDALRVLQVIYIMHILHTWPGRAALQRLLQFFKENISFQWLLLFNTSLNPCQGYRRKYVYTIEWAQDYCNISDTGASSGKLQPGVCVGGCLGQAFTNSTVLAQERIYC